ncbi:hypothetical protein COB11_00050 [Candidatus Aerophobetes bacterium]|uniref:Protein kinase domain-containing protein n=1 Tax=Aerophobetes bacterium TaxID=2030807 RepID=A0A2A4YPH9_UNCAE|nr:MAG: hypothetical protein COB11_00050 [Candidatus Aerophobetes bacterium]
MSATDSLKAHTSFDTSGVSNTLYADARTTPEDVSEGSSNISNLTREIHSSCESRQTSPALVEAATLADITKGALVRLQTEIKIRKNASALIDAPRAPLDTDPSRNRSFYALDLRGPTSKQTAEKAELFMLDDTLEAAERAHKAAAPLLFARKAKVDTPSFSFAYAKATLTRSKSAPAIISQGEWLGVGANSSVYKVTALHNTFAKKTSNIQRITYKKEFALTQQFDHPNVIRCHMATEYAMFIEHAPDGDLQHQTTNTDLTASKLRSYFRDAASGLAHMHEKGYVHRDVKLGNILIGANGALVTDLETAVKIEGFPVVDLKGTLIYLPKEAIKSIVDASDPNNVKAVDSFSFGMMIYQFLKKKEMVTPYTEKNNQTGKVKAGFQVVLAIGCYTHALNAAHIDPQLDDAKREKLDPTGELHNLMIDCLKEDPSARPQMAEIAARLAP